MPSHPELIERGKCLEIRSPMRKGMRAVLVVVALFPLLAPYELLIRVEWQVYMHPFFFLAALISGGAVTLSALLLWAAFAGLSSQMVLDKGSGLFSFSSKAPAMKRTEHKHPLSRIRNVEVGTRDWSDGSPTYYLRISVVDGAVFESSSSWSRDEVELIQARVQQFLADIDPS